MPRQAWLELEKREQTACVDMCVRVFNAAEGGLAVWKMRRS